MSIQGTCKDCGFTFLLEFGVDCPRCNLAERTERVKRIFAPVDPLRTALGMGYQSVTDRGWEHYRGMTFSNLEVDGKLVEAYGTAVVDDKAFGIPKYAEQQIWELKRMRKLIGRM